MGRPSDPPEAKVYPQKAGQNANARAPPRACRDRSARGSRKPKERLPSGRPGAILGVRPTPRR